MRERDGGGDEVRHEGGGEGMRVRRLGVREGRTLTYFKKHKPLLI